MPSERPPIQPRRDHVFRLRPFAGQTPVGERAFQAHGHASVAGLSLRTGDVLCAAAAAPLGGVQVLEPRTPGHPMLGHQHRGELRGLPANLPCSDALWSPVGAVRAVWRRELSSSAGPIAPTHPAVVGGGASRRSLCVRLPQAALALVRAEQPELRGRPLQASAQPGGTVLVFPGAQLEGQPLAQASSAALSGLAAQLLEALGAGAELRVVSAREILVTAHRELDLAGATHLARSLSRRLRLPLAVAVADDQEQAAELARALGEDQLLWLLPPSAQAAPAAQPSPEPRPAAVVAPDPRPVFAGAAPRPAASAWPSVRRRAAHSGSAAPAQLSLFAPAEAA